MLGFIAGCTQPISIRTLRAWVRCGHRLSRTAFAFVALGSTLAFSDLGSSGRIAWPSFSAGANSGEVRPSRSSQRLARSPAGRSTLASTMRRPMSTRLPYSTPDGHVVSQLRQVRQRSRCSCVERVGASPSSTCFIR